MFLIFLAGEGERERWGEGGLCMSKMSCINNIFKMKLFRKVELFVFSPWALIKKILCDVVETALSTTDLFFIVLQCKGTSQHKSITSVLQEILLESNQRAAGPLCYSTVSGLYFGELRTLTPWCEVVYPPPHLKKNATAR